MTDSFKSILIATALLIVIGVTWFFILYRPEVAELQSLKEKTEDVLMSLRSLRVTDAQVNALAERAEALKQDITAVQAKIAPKSQLPAIVEQIRRKGQRYGLKFHNIIPDYNSLLSMSSEQNGQTDILKLTLHIKLQGRYKNLGKFIESLGDLPVYLSIGELSINYQEAIHPELEIYLDTILYLRDVKKITG